MSDTINEARSAETMPMLPLRGMTVFPGMLLNFDVERPLSVAALNSALTQNQRIFLVSQSEIIKDEPTQEDLYGVGTICTLKQLLRIPGGNAVRVMVEGVARGLMTELSEGQPCYYAKVEELEDVKNRSSVKGDALLRRCFALFDEYSKLSGTLSPEVFLTLISSDDPGFVADYVTQNIYMRHTQKQLVLEELNPQKRLSLVCRMIQREISILETEQQIAERTQEQMSRSQRDYYLREQIKVLQSEIGEGEDMLSELDEYREKILALSLGDEAEEKLLKELNRLGKQPYSSAEAATLRTYLDICIELPWNKKTKETLNIDKARKVLDADHYGLYKVKDRVLEFLSVRKLAPDVKGTVLCLVGPPGVGKTSVAISIARAMNRKLARISLGGVHDEAEIRGHRKTYVGAMPGRIIAGIQQAKSSNALLLLDEIDKLGSDYRGDPSAALLEALDAEQNYAFRDHFIEIPFDLSDVFFITTANTTDTIPRALLDRMEVIEIGSYTDEEKLNIAKRNLLPKQRKKHGLTAAQLKLSDDAIREVIARYTRESGVRVLERELASVCRKVAKGIVSGEYKSRSLKSGEVEALLGAQKYKPDPVHPADEVGLVRGLAWTAVGGEVMEVEVGVLEGTGKLELTGNLGDVMKESAHAAVSYIRSRAVKLGIDPDFYKNRDIHIHFPEGAVPKDGPSAGITICIGVISALTGIPVRRDLAMTGEITLRGRILQIGGLNEKTMAALRNGVHNVIIPAANEKDLNEIDQNVRNALNFITADHVDKILDTALNRNMAAAKNAQLSADTQTVGSVAADIGDNPMKVSIRQ